MVEFGKIRASGATTDKAVSPAENPLTDSSLEANDFSTSTQDSYVHQLQDQVSQLEIQWNEGRYKSVSKTADKMLIQSFKANLTPHTFNLLDNIKRYAEEASDPATKPEHRSILKEAFQTTVANLSEEVKMCLSSADTSLAALFTPSEKAAA